MDIDWVQNWMSRRVSYWGRKYGYVWQRYSHDALALGFVEAWQTSLTGATDEQCARAGRAAALRFIRQVADEAKRCVSLSLFEDEVDGDVWHPGFQLPDQETSTDARAIARVIDDFAILETIAYGARHEGGLKRMSAEIRVNNHLKRNG